MKVLIGEHLLKAVHSLGYEWVALNGWIVLVQHCHGDFNMTESSVHVYCIAFISQWQQTCYTSDSGEEWALSRYPQAKTTLCWTRQCRAWLSRDICDNKSWYVFYHWKGMNIDTTTLHQRFMSLEQICLWWGRIEEKRRCLFFLLWYKNKQ